MSWLDEQPGMETCPELEKWLADLVPQPEVTARQCSCGHHQMAMLISAALARLIEVDHALAVRIQNPDPYIGLSVAQRRFRAIRHIARHGMNTLAMQRVPDV